MAFISVEKTVSPKASPPPSTRPQLIKHDSVHLTYHSKQANESLLLLVSEMYPNFILLLCYCVTTLRLVQKGEKMQLQSRCNSQTELNGKDSFVVR
jgi:hypothetical protein